MKRYLLILFVLTLFPSLVRGQGNQVLNNGVNTGAVNFSGCNYTWTNDQPGIGLPASGLGDINAFTAINNGNAPIIATINATSIPVQYAYIPGSNGITVINTSTNKVITTIPAGYSSANVAATPDGTRVYISDPLSNWVLVINTSTNTIMATIPVGNLPGGITVTPDGKTVFVGNYNDNSISVISTATNKVTTVLSGFDRPFQLRTAPVGNLLYVLSQTTGVTWVVNTTNNTIVNTLPSISQPWDIAISSDGTMLYIVGESDNSVHVFNATTNAAIATIPVGLTPENITISPDGNDIYVGCFNAGYVADISTSTNTVTKTINMPFAHGLAVSADGKTLFAVDNNIPGSLNAIDIATGNLITAIPTGYGGTAAGNFLAGVSCAPVTFTITVNPTPAAPPTITAEAATGSISSCAGTASVLPLVQQINIFGSNLTGDITATAPPNFEVSANNNSGYGSIAVLTQFGGAVGSGVFVRSSATAPAGNISGNITLTSPGAATQTIAVAGIVNTLPNANLVSDQTFTAGTLTTGVTFTGPANNFTWVNDTPGIGLAASGAGNIAPFTAINTGNTPVVAHITVTPVNSGAAYIPNYGDGTVSIINTSTNTIEGTVNVGENPIAVAVSPDGSRVFVANHNDNTISVIDAASGTVITAIPYGTSPNSLTITPDGQTIYVVDYSSNTVSVINASNYLVETDIIVGLGAFGIVASPDSKFVYVANQTGNSVSVISTATNTVVATIAVPNAPRGVAVSPDGSKLYVTNSGSNTVTVVNTATHTISATITVGSDPDGVTLSSDGKLAYVANNGSATVSVINTATGAVTATIPVGGGPSGISLTTGNGYAYVTNLNDNTVSVINTATNKVISTINVGSTPISFGNFIAPTNGCTGPPVTFTITITPLSSGPAITASAATGIISACAGTASASPQIQQFTVSGSNLAGNITATAPTGFEVSLNAGSGYGPNATLTQTGGTVNTTTVYVRSSALAAMGNISGKVVLTSTTTTQFVAVAGMVNALPTVNTVPAQSVNSGVATAAINFTGTGDYYTWTNDTPGIGLAASGTGNIASFTAVNTGSSPVTANITVTPKPSQFAYITDEGSNSVSVISTATNSIVANIPVGGYPIGVAVSPDGRFVYVVNRASVTLSVINTTTNAVTATIATGANPIGVAISPDGSRVYVTNEDDGTISVINTSTNAVTATVSVGQNPYGVVVSPDGSKVYVSNDNGSGTVTVVNAGSNTLIATVPVGVAPGGIVVSTDGSKVYVENFASNTVSVINTSTNLVIATIPVGTSPWGIALSPDGSRLYVSNQNSNDVFVINTADNSLVTTIPVGKNPYGVSVTADGASVYVANINSNTVSVISTVTNQVTATVAVAGSPAAFGSFITPGTNCTGVPTQFTITVNPALTIPNQVVNNGQTTMAVNFTGCDYSWVNNQPGIGLAGNGSGDINSFIAINNGVTPIVSTITATPVFSGFAYIANEDSNDVSVINTTTNKVVATVPVGSNPTSVYADMKNKKIYVANKISNSISVIDPGTNMVIGTISLSVQPESVTVSPDGTRIYVGSGPGTEVLVIDAATDAIVSTITNPALEYSVNVAVSPDGSLLYVNAFESNGIYVISTKTNSIIASVAVADEPQSIQVTPDGATVYETNAGADDVEIINTATNTVPLNIPVGMQPEGLSLSPDGRLLYTANHQSNDVSVISTATNSLVATIPVGSAPWGISVTPDGKEIYVANSGSNTVSVIDAATNRVISTIPVGKSPYSFGSFFYNTTTCNPITFTITVNPTPATSPNITATAATGNNTSCQGTASASPNIQQVQVSGINLTGAVSLTAPAGFEISLSATTGFGSSLTITPVAGTVTNVPVYVHLAATAAVGSNSGNIEGTSPGATTIEIPVTGTVNALPTVNQVANQSITNGQATTAINFTGTGNTFTWTNDTPGIGLAANGTGDIASFTGVNTGSSPITATITATPLNAGFAYISNSASNSVSVINTGTNMLVSNIPVGDDPQNVSVSPDGKKVYVTNPTVNTVSVIATATNTLIATIPVGTGAFGMVVSPDGTKVYLVNLNPAQSADNISVINTTTYAVASTITLGSKVGEITISPDGNRLYVANYSLNTVSVINTATGAVAATVPVGSYPYGITASPDGSRVYVANEIDNTVSVISTSTNAVIATVPTGASPIGVAVSPDGSRLYATNFFVNGTVSVINTNTNAIIATVPVGQAPAGVSISADGRLVYVANSSSADVSVIDAATNSVIMTVPVGSNPFSYGNFVSPSSCSGAPTQFTITVNPSPATGPDITATAATGAISTCAGTASVSPQIQQFTVSGSNLAGNITATAPTGFEVSLSAGSGYGPGVTLTQSGGTVNSTTIYVRSSATAASGSISGNVVLTSTTATQDVAVSGMVNALPIVDPIPNQNPVISGNTTASIHFNGTANTYTWVNSTPSIGLAASGVGDIGSFTAVNHGASPVVATITVSPASVSYSYITNAASNTVSVVNTLTNTVVKSITLGSGPSLVAVNPIGNSVYVSNGTNISVVSSITNEVSATISTVGAIAYLAVSPDGSKLYMVSDLTPSTIYEFSTSTNSLIGTIPLSSIADPGDIVVSRDGNFIYVVDQSGFVAVINAVTNQTITSTPVGQSPYDITISPDGSKVYVANSSSNTVSVINTINNTIIATIPVGASPEGLVVSPDGGSLYVANRGSNTVSVVNTTTNIVIATIPIGKGAWGVSVSPDGTEVYVVQSIDNTVSVINTATNTVKTTIVGFSAPFSSGNFISPGTGCTGPPIQFTITINPAPATTPTITTVAATGTISACVGTASVSPQIQQFTVSGVNLTANITAVAPTNFEVSLSPGSGYGPTITITQSGGDVNTTVVYVRSAAIAAPGPVSGNVMLSSPGATSQDVAVNGFVNDLPTVDPIAALITANGLTTAAINFTGSGNTFTWTNDTPSIGLPAGGSGNIASFTAVNPGTGSVIATVTVTPGTTVTGCTGAPETFTITVGPTPPTAVTATGILSPLTTSYGTPSPSETFSVSGTSLTLGILVTPPTGFEISTNNVNFSPTLTISGGGNVSAQTVYIRLAAVTPVGPYSGNIKVTSPGAVEFDLPMPVSTVTPALLAIIADDKNKTFGTLNPPLTATYVGFVNLETVANLTTLPLLATTATTFSPIGQYPITVTGASSTNYTISYLNGTLTIAPTEQSIVIPNTFTPNGDGINDTWDIKYLDLYVNCSVDIFTRWGQKVYSSIGYSIPWDGTYKSSALPTGTYYYVINLKNGLSPLAGFVAIIR